jgi:hypothetical protein
MYQVNSKEEFSEVAKERDVINPEEKVTIIVNDDIKVGSVGPISNIELIGRGSPKVYGDISWNSVQMRRLHFKGDITKCAHVGLEKVLLDNVDFRDISVMGMNRCTADGIKMNSIMYFKGRDVEVGESYNPLRIKKSEAIKFINLYSRAGGSDSVNIRNSDGVYICQSNLESNGNGIYTRHSENITFRDTTIRDANLAVNTSSSQMKLEDVDFVDVEEIVREEHLEHSDVRQEGTPEIVTSTL